MVASLKVTPYVAKPATTAAARVAAEPMSIEQEQTAGAAASRIAKAAATPAGGANRAKVYFDTDSDLLPPQVAATLGPLVRMLSADPGVTVDITGYADASGTSERNVQLAKDRAKAVRAALIAQGVSPDRTNLKQPATVSGGTDDREARRVEVAVGRRAPAAPATK